MKIHESFPRYNDFNPLLETWCVTPAERGVIHRFFDTSPFSPSGRYMALFKMPFEDHWPQPGDSGSVIIVDLQTGQTREVTTTCGWEMQLGANVQWGATDNELFFNDVDTASWQPMAWKLDPFTGERMKIPGGIYRVSPDGRHALVCNLSTMQRTQKGYGVIVPDEYVPLHKGLSDDDGLWLIDTATGQRKLLISIEQAVKQTTEQSEWDSYSQMEVYGFHCKWSSQGDRLLFSLRYYPVGLAGSMEVLSHGCHFDVFTARPDGTELFNAVPDEQWQKDGHHINFFPDGDKLSMNLAIDSDRLKFVQVNIDGSELKPIIYNIPGSGHPTIHPDGHHILTDEYSFGLLAWPDGTIPLRWIDIEKQTEKTLVRIPAKTDWQEGKSQLRLDPHPAWSNDYKWIAYNAFIDGTRKVLISKFPEDGI